VMSGMFYNGESEFCKEGELLAKRLQKKKKKTQKCRLEFNN